MLFYPEAYFKDCDSCKKYVMVDGRPHEVNGVKTERIPGEKPNCKTCEKSALTTLSSENWYTWAMYKRHKHFGLEPHERADSLVQRHMITIGEIEEASRMKQNPLLGIL